MFCKECGHQIADSSKFCEGCGKPITQAQETKPVAEENKAETKGRSGCGKFFIFILAITAIFTVIDNVVEASKPKPTPEQEEKTKKERQRIKARVELEYEIKEKIRDPKSYEYIDGKYLEANEILYLTIRFRSNNAFGGKAVSTVMAAFDIKTEPMKWKIVYWKDN